jgi:tetratricopeptide (TPR) repeat protein
VKPQTQILVALTVFVLIVDVHAQSASTVQAQPEGKTLTEKSSVVASNVQSQPASTAKSSDPTLLDTSFIKGVDAMHNLDFDGAGRHFEEVKRRFPDHPAGPYYLAANLFLKTLTKPSRLLPLLSNLSRSKTFSGSGGDPVEPASVQQFRALTRQSNLLAKTRLDRNRGDATALYFLGATQGLTAAFKGTLEGSVVGAMREGSGGVDKHRDVLRLDPNFRDAEMSIGLYEYTVGALPLAVKVLAAVANVRGSKKRGLQTLERVGREGNLERNISKLILVILYKREKQYANSLERARELSGAYPRSYLFKLAEAEALVAHAAGHRQTDQTAAAKMEREAFAIFDSLLQTREGPARPVELIHFIYGEALLKAEQAERAAQEFVKAAAVPRAEPSIATIAHLRGAQAFDLAGRRREAVAEYEIVMKRPNVYDSHERAKQGLRKPYRE